MSAASRSRELEAALAALPETDVGEIVFGRLVTQPRPAMRHAISTGRLFARLSSAFDSSLGGPGGWIFAFEPELQLGPHVLVPDIAAWRVETVTESELDVARVSVVPDWVCETLSTSTERFDRDEKSLIYGANGVGHRWFVDPIARTIEAARNERGRWHDVGTFAADALARIEPFDALELEVASLFLR